MKPAAPNRYQYLSAMDRPVEIRAQVVALQTITNNRPGCQHHRLIERIEDSVNITGDYHSIRVMKNLDGIPSFELIDHRTDRRIVVESPKALLALHSLIELAATGYTDDDSLRRDRDDAMYSYGLDEQIANEPEEHDND